MLSTLAGVVRNYSPVPYWDMWDGSVRFYLLARDGSVGAWWSPHNEHRIVVGKILFWFDHALFGGRAVLLQIANCVQLAAIAALLVMVALRPTAGGAPRDPLAQRMLAVGIVAMCFSWLQSDNLIEGFQASFHPALLVPLTAFIAFEHAAAMGFPVGRFAIAAALGILSVGTMANGLAVLPLLLVAALVARAPARQVAVLAALSIASAALYFVGYHRPEADGSLSGVIQHPVAMMRYATAFLGGAFGSAANGCAPCVASAVGTLGLIGVAGLWLRRQHDRPFPSAELLLLTYIVASALGAAAGRMNLSIETALSSRYTTYSLVFWAALAVAFYRRWTATGNMRPALPRALATAVALLPLLWLTAQGRAAFEDPHARIFERMAAALAFEMGVRDHDQLGHIYPSVEAGFAVAEPARRRALAVFGDERLHGVRERLGAPAALAGGPFCTVEAVSRNIVPGDKAWVRVEGWISGPPGRSPPATIDLVSGNRLVGYGIVSGGRIPDAQGRLTDRHPFKAYLLASANGEITYGGRSPACRAVRPE